jgi:7-cyano-7-deazaguanine synthase in queuosine biosynthesis
LAILSDFHRQEHIRRHSRPDSAKTYVKSERSGAININEKSTLEIGHDDKYAIEINFFDIDSSQKCDNGDLQVNVGLPRLEEFSTNRSLWNAIKGFYTLAVASIVTTRLGDPFGGNVAIKTDEFIYPETTGDFVDILRHFSHSRTLAKEGIIRDHKIQIKHGQNGMPFHMRFDRDKVELAFSGGMDSLACKLFMDESGYDTNAIFIDNDPKKTLREKESVWLLGDLYRDLDAAKALASHVTYIINDITSLDKIPWKTRLYPDMTMTWDFDDWGFYGRNFLSAISLLYMNLLNKSGYSVVGHTRGSMNVKVFGKDIEFYQDCCQSAFFVKKWNNILQRHFLDNPPYHTVPLAEVSKGRIAKYLLRHPENISKSHSCVEEGDIECGACFSCAQKMTGILAAAEPDNLDIDQDHNIILYKGYEIARFGWMPVSHDSGYWNTQLERFAMEYPDLSRTLRNSCLNPSMFLAACYNLDGRNKIKIPGIYHEIKKKIGEDRIRRYYTRYCSEGKIMSPSEFVRRFS